MLKNALAGLPETKEFVVTAFESARSTSFQAGCMMGCAGESRIRRGWIRFLLRQMTSWGMASKLRLSTSGVVSDAL